MAESSELEIIEASGQEVAAVQDLWRDYWDSLGLPQDFQRFSGELQTLPGVYAPPMGRLLLALVQGNAAGTAALRPLSGRSCEAKRLYVRPQYRGKGVGRALLCRLLEEARSAGYREVYGDTLKSMTAALEMYRQIGFSEVAPYSSNPTPGAIFLRLSLSAAPYLTQDQPDAG
jgi:putative acetyltransferase